MAAAPGGEGGAGRREGGRAQLDRREGARAGGAGGCARRARVSERAAARGGQRVLGGGRAPGRERFPGTPAPCRFLPLLGDVGYLGRGKDPQHRAAAPPALPAPGGLQIPRRWSCALRQSRGQPVAALREGKALPSLPA